MPSDTYILTISDAGVSIPSDHASTHLTGGSDAIPVATTSTSGLMSSAIFDQHVINTAKVSNATHTGDVTDASGVLTVSKINGVSLASLSTGILKNTTSTGAPSIAVAADFPILNQSTTGNAATATTAGSATTATSASGLNGVSLAGLSTGILKNTTSTGVPSIAVAADFPTLNQSTTGNAATATTASKATNVAGGSAGSIPYQSAPDTTSFLGAGTSGYVLTSNGSSPPSWGSISLSTQTTGTVPVSNGGTGQTTFTAGLLKANGTNSFTTVAAPTGAVVGISDTQTLTNKTLTSPTLITPVLGTPSSGTLTSCTGLPLTTGVTGILPVANGGTGQSSYAVGDLLYADTTTSVAKLQDITAGNVLLSGGLNTAPSYGKVGLTTHVTGTLPVANGGTGAVTLTGYVKGTGTTAMTAAATVPVADISGTLPVANGGTGLATITGYVKGTGTAALSTSSTIPATDISGTLLAEKGGTGYSSFAVGDLLYAGTTTSLAKLADVAAGSVLLSGGLNTAPSYGKVSLGEHVTGILPLENGGTGQDLSDEGSGVVVKNGSDIIDIVTTLPKGYGGTGQTESAYGGCYLISPTATTISSANVWTKVIGTTTFITGEGVDNGTSNNQIRNLTYNKNLLISVTGSLTGSNANIIKIGVFLDGGLIVNSPVQVTTAGATHLTSFSCQCYAPSVDYGSYIELFVQNTSSSNSVTFDSFNVFARNLI